MLQKHFGSVNYSKNKTTLVSPIFGSILPKPTLLSMTGFPVWRALLHAGLSGGRDAEAQGVGRCITADDPSRKSQPVIKKREGDLDEPSIHRIHHNVM